MTVSLTTFLTTLEQYFLTRNKQICEASIHNQTLASRIKSVVVRVWKFITRYYEIYL